MRDRLILPLTRARPSHSALLPRDQSICRSARIEPRSGRLIPRLLVAVVALTLVFQFALPKITEAFDPPLVGAKIDRVQRHGESYVKDWKPLKLGTIDLKPGRGELTLRAKEVAGKHVADVRMVMLTLVK